MDKAYSPRRHRAAHLRALGNQRLVPAERPRAALFDRHSAAERHRHAAHGARVPGHDHGRPHPLSPHARLRHPLAARHRSRRHRDPDGGRAPAERGRQEPARSRARSFVERVWEWKEQSGGTIARQMRRLGASVDWTRDRFTMDPSLSEAVDRGLRAPARRGADLPRQAAGQLGPGAAHGALGPRGRVARRKRPPLAPAATRSRTAAGTLIVATTRPETMLGDTAVAVNPDDERYRHLIGRRSAPAARRPRTFP